jgi:hypothetical protein
MTNNKQQIKSALNQVECAIRKHKHLAAWGNVESRERLRVLRQRKKSLQAQLDNMEC